jgi:hypothetical protein
MKYQPRDTPVAEAKLAQELVGQARQNWFANKNDKAAELARDIVDRYWGVEGSRATRLVADAYSVYLDAVAEQVKTVEQAHLVLEQYDMLTARCLKAGLIPPAIKCLRSKVLRSHLWGERSAIYAAATRAILLVQEHRDALTDENGERMPRADLHFLTRSSPPLAGASVLFGLAVDAACAFSLGIAM